MTHTLKPDAPSLQPAPLPESGVGTQSFVTTWLLALLLGGLGIDRFFLGKIGTGILKLVTFGGLGIWALVDLIIALAGWQRDKQGRLPAGYARRRVLAWIVIGAVSGGSAGVGVGAAAVPDVAPPAATAPAQVPAATSEKQAAPVAKKWTTVQSLEGTADSATQVFELTGAEAQLSYDFKDGGIPIVMLSKAGSNVTALHKTAGRYYLDVRAANVDSWSVKVEEKR